MIYSQPEICFDSETKSLVVGVFADGTHDFFSKLDETLGGELGRLKEGKHLSSKLFDVTPVLTLGKLASPKIYAIGLGKMADFGLEQFRKAAGKAAQSIKEDAVFLLGTFLTDSISIQEGAAAAAEALTLAAYSFDKFKTEKKDQPPKGDVYVHAHGEIGDDIERGKILGEATNSARDLYNLPGNKLTASGLAGAVKSFADERGLECRIIEKPEMEAMGMGGILGVNAGSVEPPKMIVVKYQGRDDFEDVTALVGKGLTFDTGGYSLKPRTAMNGMQGDMGGAASAFGAFAAAVNLRLCVNLLLVIPSTDNMVSATAIKPGDVIKTMSGKTVEVTNTDAEGRLILSDALTLAKKEGASRIIDLATLTGAIIVALGSDITGAFTNHPEMFNQLKAASEKAGEDIWQMPLSPRDQKALRNSLTADLNNAPLNKPGSIMAAAFLKEFVGDTPWVHLDIAGTAEAKNVHELGPKGGTGVMVRTIAKYLEQLAE